VGKSALAGWLLKTEGIPWLPTDVVRTVLRRVLPELDALDRDPVDAARLAEFMYPHIEQAAEVCAEEAVRFLIEGFELSPSYPARLRAALVGTAGAGVLPGCWQDGIHEDLLSEGGTKCGAEAFVLPRAGAAGRGWAGHVRLGTVAGHG
jgi:hypothetical protein